MIDGLLYKGAPKQVTGELHKLPGLRKTMGYLWSLDKTNLKFLTIFLGWDLLSLMQIISYVNIML